MTLYRAILQFEQDGPAVTGEWHDDAVARAAYKTWIGLYTKHPALVVQLTAEDDDGTQRTLRKWAADQEVITEPGHPL
ncbi:hypothetical protein [Streptomyces sp. NPDC047453]|uniref:hypothetical protein n=1 Tax=Streptomyces sp. NPDC047453 TaxID=3154812 RepID=UPI003406A0A5